MQGKKKGGKAAPACQALPALFPACPALPAPLPCVCAKKKSFPMSPKSFGDNNKEGEGRDGIRDREQRINTEGDGDV